MTLQNAVAPVQLTLCMHQAIWVPSLLIKTTDTWNLQSPKCRKHSTHEYITVNWTVHRYFSLHCQNFKYIFRDNMWWRWHRNPTWQPSSPSSKPPSQWGSLVPIQKSHPVWIHWLPLQAEPDVQRWYGYPTQPHQCITCISWQRCTFPGPLRLAC